MSKDEQDAWRRWEAARARIRERTPREPSRRERRLWLLVHIVAFGLLSWAMGYAARRDGLLTPFVIGDGIVLAGTVALIVMRLLTLI